MRGTRWEERERRGGGERSGQWSPRGERGRVKRGVSMCEMCLCICERMCTYIMHIYLHACVCACVKYICKYINIYYFLF